MLKSLWRSLVNWLTRSVNKIAEANEKSYGGRTPDCCGRQRAAK